MSYPRVASLKTAAAFRDRLQQVGAAMEFDDALDAPGSSPLAQPFELGGIRVGNRFCILPMEGWDGTADGHPSELTRRRWHHFGESGAKLIWGGEAVAVQFDGRASSRQLPDLGNHQTRPGIAARYATFVAAHREALGSNADGDLYIGLQLTHSGRYSQPSVKGRMEPRVAYAHPLLDRRFPARHDDDERRRHGPARRSVRRCGEGGVRRRLRLRRRQALPRLSRSRAAQRAHAGRASLRRVDRKPDAVRAQRDRRNPRHGAPRLGVAVRLSAFDIDPAWEERGGGRRAGRSRRSPMPRRSAISTTTHTWTRRWRTRGNCSAYSTAWASGGSASPRAVRTDNPHMQRPALFPPSDGYLPPEDLRCAASHDTSPGPRSLQTGFPPACDRGVSVQLPAGVATQRGAVQRAARSDMTSSRTPGAWCCHIRGWPQTCSPAVRSSAR